MPLEDIMYSERYNDEFYEYRHVMLPEDIEGMVPSGRLLSEAEWRALGVQQSRGWVHYSIHRPEPHILLCKRPLNFDPDTFKQRMELHQAAAAAGAPFTY